MNAHKVLRGFSVLAIVFFGLIPPAATTAHYLPGVTAGSFPTAGAAALVGDTRGSPAQGIGSMGGDATAAACAGILRQQLETVLPSGWSDTEACRTLQAMGIPFQSSDAAQTVDPASTACAVALRQELGTALPSGWADAQACSTLQAMGVPVQANIVAAAGDTTSITCAATLRQVLETVLPGGLANAQACTALESVVAAQQPGVIPLTGVQTAPTDPIACWRDAGATNCP